MKKKSVKARNILLLSKLDEILAKAAKENIEIILLKGAALLKEGIFGMDEREMSDIDILVKNEDSEKLEKIFLESGFSAMENSSASFIFVVSGKAPPVIIDVHKNLFHVRDIREIWEKGTRKANNFRLLSEDEFILHETAHSFIHHGVLPAKTIKDIKRFLSEKKEIVDGKFTDTLAEKARERKLLLMLGRVLREAGEKKLAADIGGARFPKASEFILLPLVRKAVKRHSRMVEYLFPLFYRPAAIGKIFWPGKEFLERRYGESGIAARLKRPFLVLKNILSGGNE